MTVDTIEILDRTTGKKFKMHVTDPLTGKREVKEIGV